MQGIWVSWMKWKGLRYFSGNKHKNNEPTNRKPYTWRNCIWSMSVLVGSLIVPWKMRSNLQQIVCLRIWFSMKTNQENHSKLYTISSHYLKPSLLASTIFGIVSVITGKRADIIIKSIIDSFKQFIHNCFSLHICQTNE